MRELPEQAVGDGVKRTGPGQRKVLASRALCLERRPNNSLYPPRHFAGGPPRKREQENSRRIYAGENHVRHAMRESHGFARACAGDNQKGTRVETTVGQGLTERGRPALRSIQHAEVVVFRLLDDLDCVHCPAPGRIPKGLSFYTVLDRFTSAERKTPRSPLPRRRAPQNAACGQRLR